MKELEKFQAWANWLFLANAVAAVVAILLALVPDDMVARVSMGVLYSAIIVLGVAIGVKMTDVPVEWLLIWMGIGIGMLALETFFWLGVSLIVEGGILVLFFPLLGIIFLVLYPLLVLAGIGVLLSVAFTVRFILRRVRPKSHERELKRIWYRRRE